MRQVTELMMDLKEAGISLRVVHDPEGRRKLVANPKGKLSGDLLERVKRLRGPVMFHLEYQEEDARWELPAKDAKQTKMRKGNE